MRIRNIVLSLLMILAGFLMIGIGYTMNVGHPMNTIVFLSGFLIFILGCIFFMITAIND